MVFLPPRKRWGLGQLLDSSTSLHGGKSSTVRQKHQHFLLSPLMGREEYKRARVALPLGKKELADS